MSLTCRLTIHLPLWGTAVQEREPSWNDLEGGPELLLRWLESQLGLVPPEERLTHRVVRYARLLEGAGEERSWSSSLATDRWATAAELLRRRDELRLAGWDGTAAEGLPSLVRDMAAVEPEAAELLPGPAERIDAVLAALEAGQRLPDHEVLLEEPGESWPRAWRPLLERLETRHAPAEGEPLAPEGTGLAAAQAVLLGSGEEDITADDSFRWIAFRSQLTACEAVADLLSEEPEELGHTAVCCGDERVALQLDAALARRGLPTLGAATVARELPVLQVLPLALQLLWEPVDPEVLLELVSLPVGPIPRAAGRALAEALAEQPGYGSRAWEATIARLTHEERDPEGRHAAAFSTWLDHRRIQRGGRLPAEMVRERCRRVAGWAVARAGVEEAEALVEGLLALAGQAERMAEVTRAFGAELTEPQLDRLLDACREGGVLHRPREAALGGAVLVGSLAEILRPVRRLVWLGLGTGEPPLRRWTSGQIDACREHGIELDDGRRALGLQRSAERRGLARVEERLLAVGLPEDAEKRPHPLWSELLVAWQEEGEGKGPAPYFYEDLLEEGRWGELAPWRGRRERVEVMAPQPPRPFWDVPAELLRLRRTASATSLVSRLACPLQWTLSYGARLRASPIARLPEGNRLKGSFCHSVLEEVFGSEPDAPLPSPEEAREKTARVFDERLPRDAAPLAQPARRGERARLRRDLLNAVGTLVETLAAGDYRVRAMEHRFEVEVEGRPVCGYIDCLAAREDGREAVLDFKYGSSLWTALLREGRAVQLAVYAAARAAETGRTRPAVGYLQLHDGLLTTPEGSALLGAPPRHIVRGAPDIHDVWHWFDDALRGAEGWTTGEEPLSARPLLGPEAWPDGADLVLDEKKASKGDAQSSCRWCDYPALCGLEVRP